MPSDLIVEVVEISDILDHPNADRLEIAMIKGWQCVVPKGAFKPGDKVVYLPIDSVLPEDLEARLFPPESKIKLSKSRIKTIKIRGAISQGMVITLEEAGLDDSVKVGKDVKELLNISKYVPPEDKRPAAMRVKGRTVSKKEVNPHFHKYTSISNIKNYPKVFESIEGPFVATEKIHGTNFRCGYVPRVPRRFRDKVRSRMPGFIKKVWKQDEWEFVYGSHNVQMQDYPSRKSVYYDKNVYKEAVEKYDLRNVLKHGEVVYGEIYGDKIQKNYEYGCGHGERRLAVFDVQINGKYAGHEDIVSFARERGLNMPPVLYVGPWNYDEILRISEGKSVLAPKSQPMREGCVVRPLREQQFYGGRAILKSINPHYLLKKQSEWS